MTEALQTRVCTMAGSEFARLFRAYDETHRAIEAVAAGALQSGAAVDLADTVDALIRRYANMDIAPGLIAELIVKAASDQGVMVRARADVPAGARKMIADRTANTEKLIQTVEAGGGSLEEPAALDEKRQAILETLNGASGAEFEAAYIDAQVQAQAEAAALTTSYSQGGDSESLKQFASQALPAIQMHCEMVQKMDQGM